MFCWILFIVSYLFLKRGSLFLWNISKKTWFYLKKHGTFWFTFYVRVILQAVYLYVSVFFFYNFNSLGRHSGRRAISFVVCHGLMSLSQDNDIYGLYVFMGPQIIWYAADKFCLVPFILSVFYLFIYPLFQATEPHETE